MALIHSTTPLGANATFTSSVFQTTRATQITGIVFADQPGTFTVAQSGDGVHFDIDATTSIVANIGEAVEIDVFEQWFQVTYTNGATDQTVFRLYVDLRDPYGDFLAASQSPSSGGAWLVLYFNQTTNAYEVVGRFDGSDAWNANQNAAIFKKRSGKYASVPVANLVATTETLTQLTTHTPIGF